ncbi:ABC transporter substrate-binding protein [Mycobacterium sp. KBS0706]|uniref:ABC transporter substrate-binding protein n=1 Tax=Mycobacterium sp. KBS0706 TaxID=2578109 RepID=UPI00110FD1BB|nr:ABC transporter substrate-binding protein [Mycobacterium sp. KBS0706]TSD83221.1 ABC transporter substrate-binding protein [Mycobacterium sp. KBS0706]
MKLHVLALGLIAAGLLSSGEIQAQTKVKVGVMNDRSGVYADITGEGSVVAARMAAEDFAAVDKGLTVEIVSADHQNKPDIGSNIARQWYDRDGVDAILDVPTSSVALAVNQITRDKNKIFLNSGAGTSDLTGAQCSPNTVHWTYDTWALAHGTASALIAQGDDTWFFITADYAFGHALERDASALVKAQGGTVAGSVRHPFPGQDFASFLLQAQASGAKVVALANAGGDTINAIKQASEFGLQAGGQKLAGLLTTIRDVKTLGPAAQGLLLTESFYWDMNDGTRAFSKRFAERMGGQMPSMIQAGVYASLTHYLKAVAATKGKDPAAVMAWMKANPSDDPLFGRGRIRADGRHIHPMYLFQAKAPGKGDWDLYTLRATIPADQAFRPEAEGGCPLVKS